MKERLINNLGLKILSIFLAFFVWLVVVNVSNPDVTRSKEVQLEIENEQVLLAANRTYELSGKSTVTVSYGVRTRDEYKIRATDFRAYIDLAELYDVTGSVPVKIEILNNKEIMKDVVAKPGVVRVDTEELQRKGFALSVTANGEAGEGYALNGVVTTPDYLYVEGPVSQIGQISHVGIEVSIEGLTEDMEAVTEPVFYDSNSNRLTLGDRVHADVMEIPYRVTINRVKKLSLDFEVSGSVAPGYQFVGAECDIKAISVIGLRTNLASLNKITIPASELNLDGATADKIVKVNLQSLLPEGVEIVQSENSEIEVRLRVERLETINFKLSENDIQMSGGSDRYDYTLIPTQVVLTMQGLKEDLASLNAEDLQATLNMTGMNAGTHRGTLTFRASDAFTILSYTEFQVEVTPKGPDAGTASESPQETVNSETAQTPDSNGEETDQTGMAG